MADDDFLSQDDIDALMSGGGDGEGSGGSSNGEEGVGIEDIQSVLKVFSRHGATVIGNALNKTVDMNVEELEVANGDNIFGAENQFREDALMMNVPFSNGLDGVVHYIIDKKSTAFLSDLMMMGDGSAEYEEDHKDALSELGNQMMGAISTAMGTEFGTSVTCEQTSIDEYGDSSISYELEKCYVANIIIKIQDFDDIHVSLVLSPEWLIALSQFYQSSSKSEVVDEVMGDGGEDSGEDYIEVEEEGGVGSAVYASSGNAKIDMLLDIPLDVTIELGRSELSIRKILELGPGSIVELDRKASEPVDLMVNDKVVARGEVVVVDEYFGIRIVSLISPEERIKHLR